MIGRSPRLWGVNLRQGGRACTFVHPLRVVVTGPLAAYAAWFCAVAQQGYAAQPALELAQLMAM